MTKLVSRLVAALALYAGLLGASVALAQAPTPAPVPAQAQTQKQAPQLKGFPTPEAAADALTDAIRKHDDKAITAILGVDWHTLIPGSDWQDDELRDNFLKAWDESHKIIQETPDKALVGAGTTGWVSPIPIVKQGDVWRYDVDAGQDRAGGAPHRPQRVRRHPDPAGDRRCAARLRGPRSDEDRRAGLCAPPREFARARRTDSTGRASRARHPVRSARCLPRRSWATSSATAITATASGCSTARGPMRRAARATISSATA